MSPSATRALAAFAGTVFFGILTPVMWFCTGMMTAIIVHTHKGDMAGWTALSLLIAGAPVGAVIGLVVSVFGSPETWWIRWLVTAFVLFLAGLAMVLLSIG